MKKLVLALLLAVGFACNAQTIHWITFIDTADERVGSYDVTGRKVLYGHFINVINAALAEKGYKSNVQDIYGTALSPEKCRQVVQQFQCEPNDIVMFYYIGHGTHGEKGKGDLPLMCLAGDDVRKFVPLAWVHNQLKQKNPRLLATIGMCCNVFQPISRGPEASYSPNYGNTYLDDTQKRAIQKMFLENKGDIVVASASPGQSSYPGTTPYGNMDIFTAALIANFEGYMASGELDWLQIFNDLRQCIHQITKGEQTPFFIPNLSASQAPSTASKKSRPVSVDTNTKDVTPSESSSDASEQQLINALAEAFDYLIDNRLSEEQRIEQELNLNRVFSADAIVRVMSQDGNQVVDRSSAEDFLGRLATSRILLKVIPVSVTVKNNKIVSLKVKETYNK